MNKLVECYFSRLFFVIEFDAVVWSFIEQLKNMEGFHYSYESIVRMSYCSLTRSFRVEQAEAFFCGISKNYEWKEKRLHGSIRMIHFINMNWRTSLILLNERGRNFRNEELGWEWTSLLLKPWTLSSRMSVGQTKLLCTP